MKKLIGLLVIGALLGVSREVMAQNYSSSLPVPPASVVPVTPTPTPMATTRPVVIATPTPVATVRPVVTATTSAVPTAGGSSLTYLLLLGGISTCIFTIYKLKLKG